MGGVVSGESQSREETQDRAHLLGVACRGCGFFSSFLVLLHPGCVPTLLIGLHLAPKCGVST